MDNKEITLTLNLVEINKISEALGDKPLKDVMDVFLKIRSQTLMALQTPPEVPVKVEEPAEEAVSE